MDQFNIKEQLNDVTKLRTDLLTSLSNTNSDDPNSPISTFYGNITLITEASDAIKSVRDSGIDKTTYGMKVAPDQKEEDPAVTRAIGSLNTWTK